MLAKKTRMERDEEEKIEERDHADKKKRMTNVH